MLKETLPEEDGHGLASAQVAFPRPDPEPDGIGGSVRLAVVLPEQRCGVSKPPPYGASFPRRLLPRHP
jgi:hypothetical protein